ncbi:Asp-tRNA(Asn)/Glu-tRNA(Gln) amidotransferase subunit GatC [bacterium]|nr:Asp-tRNA(Asn)/Glu-tRNA(Gln) amidotransferase subunit GatC [bacterium]
MSEITRETVEKIAQLANLKVDKIEAGHFADQLAKILEHFYKLNELDTQGVPQTVHALPIKNVWRPDEMKPGLENAEALDQAPDAYDNAFRVPRIIE